MKRVWSFFACHDDAAREAVALIENPGVRILDASTAHRTAPGWVYGFPELENGLRQQIALAARVSNPGCYPTGFLALVRPLVRAGLLPVDFPITVNAVSGYSGGGKAMIAEFEDTQSSAYVETVVRTYALSLAHKHAREMHVHSGLEHPPVFAPSVGRFYRGMLVEVPLQLWALPKKPVVADLHGVLSDAYHGESLIEVASLDEALEMKTLDAELLKHTNGMKLYVFGNDKTHQARLVALLDNLGKGASGAAVQNLNLMLGFPKPRVLSDMYRPRAYSIDDPDVLHEMVRTRRFATIAAAVDGAVQFAYAPVVLDAQESSPGRIRFHLARLNPLADMDDAPIRLSFLGPDAYISPDWYETHALVPTWNYVAVEASGTARPLNDAGLMQLLVDLSAEEERRLAPKTPWTLAKLPDERIAMLLNAIRGFEVVLTSLEGKFKLSQDKNEADLSGAITGLEARGDTASLAVAAAMRRAAQSRS